MLNAAPDAADDFFTRPEDTAISGNLLANDSDLDGDTLSLFSATPPSTGALITDPAGNFTYTPSTNFVGDASFTYTISDGNGGADTASVTFRVTNINDIPDAKNDFFAIREEKVTLNALANDTDVDLANPVHTKFNTDPPDALRIIAVGMASNGQTALSAEGLVSYTPNRGFSGNDVFTYTVSDRGQDGIAGTSDDKMDTAHILIQIEIVDFFGIQGTGGDDAYLVRRDSSGANVEVFGNDAATGPLLFATPVSTAPPLPFDTRGGDDRLIIEGTNGNPVPFGGLHYIGGGDRTAGDRLIIRGGGIANGTYFANATTPGTGKLTLGGRDVTFLGVEAIDVSILNSFTVVTPNANDTLTLSSPADGSLRLAGTSGGLTLSPVNAREVGSFIIDAATEDKGVTVDDSLTVTADGVLPGNAGFVEYRSGRGGNTLVIQSGTTRIDSTTSGDGTLDTNVADGAQIVTHRVRQRSLTLGNGSRASVVPDGTSAGTSVLDNLSIPATATFDLSDNDLVLNPTAADRLSVFGTLYERLKSGYATGAWSGNGLASSAAQGNIDSTLALVDNAVLGMTQFSGELVDANSLLLNYTYSGDIDLNGTVDADDLTVFANNFGRTTGATQIDGDVDFNGTVDADDFTVFANNFGKRVGAALAAVPPAAAKDPPRRASSVQRTKDEMGASVVVSLPVESLWVERREMEHAASRGARRLHSVGKFAVPSVAQTKRSFGVAGSQAELGNQEEERELVVDLLARAIAADSVRDGIDGLADSRLATSSRRVRAAGALFGGELLNLAH
jgi:hypothetical protein